MRKESDTLIYRFEYTGDAKIILELHSHRLVCQCLEHGEDKLAEIKALSSKEEKWWKACH